MPETDPQQPLPAAPPVEPAGSEAAATAAPLDDRSGAFVPFTLAADALDMREICAGFFERVPTEHWTRRTELRPSGWTLHETLAHVEATAHVLNRVVTAALAGQPVEIAGLSERADLRAWNRAEIAARAATPSADLVASFLAALGESARIAGQLAPDELTRAVSVPIYHGAPTIGELLGGAIMHPGIVHAAQLANGARSQPLWIWYRPGMMRRQLTRFFHIMGHSYWPERGGSLHATIAFTAIGPGGGSWYVRAEPAGGRGQLGVVRTPDLHLTFASADLLCRLFTLQASPLRSLLLRQLRVQGNLGLARRFPRLFTPT